MESSMSSSVDRARLTISRLAVKDLPEPDTPRTKPLPLSSSFRLAMMRFLLMTFCP